MLDSVGPAEVASAVRSMCVWYVLFDWRIEVGTILAGLVEEGQNHDCEE